MSSVFSSGPVWRLLWRASPQKPSVTAAERFEFLPGVRASTRRQYAKIIKPINRSSRPPQRRPPPPEVEPSWSRTPKLSARKIPDAASEPARLLFSESDIPLLPEWVSSLENLGQEDLTAIQCMEGARRYVSVATNRESQWRGQLEKSRQPLSPNLLWSRSLASQR